MTFQLRAYEPTDAAAVNEVALAAFEELRGHYSDWPKLSRYIAKTSVLADTGEMMVATVQSNVAGAVTYVGPGKEKLDFFPVEWPILRMLVVAPAYRGLGIGRALTDDCIRRARRDNASVIALHTTPIMNIALPMYERMGFVYERETAPILGVPYGVYVKQVAI